MAWFRCGGGTSLQTLAKENVLNNFRLAVGDIVNFTSSFYFETLENAYGWSNSHCTRVTISSRGNIDNLINFFSKYGYDAGYEINTADENLPRWVLQATTGDPNQQGYPGSESGYRNVNLFYARFDKNNSYIDSLSKYDRKQLEYLLDTVGASTSFSVNFWAKQNAGRSATVISRPSWLDVLLPEAGYQNITQAESMPETTNNQGSIRITTANLS